MKIFYKNSYKLIDGMTACVTCPFSLSLICAVSANWFHCSKRKLVLDNTQIFNL